ncbi:MAG: hypothetical protein A2Z20_11495 [Bdellovibrionales bacterium RBG_16_40_8]|nr:MAG: hypothetical protein A2Z20_11495 [Bdellovibrionales bacterium RBG_16_40_8]
MGTKMEWVFRPMGVDWRVGVGLISAFAAREVFVSSLAVMFNIVESDSPETLRSGIIEQMQQAKFADGSPIFTFASVVSLLVFFMLAFQCMATFATAKQEMGSMRFAIIQLVSMNVLAYILSVITYSVIAI